jgi:four helix bundle protein
VKNTWRFSDSVIYRLVVNTLDQAKQLQDRIKNFAVRIIKAFARLPKDEALRIIGRQFLRSGTSVAANYRAACRARSSADFISKMSVVAEEADETFFWLELLVEAKLIKLKLVESLMKECEELLRIFSASLAIAKRNR